MINIETQHYLFLDDLRASGVTNMLGAPAYLMSIFDLTKAEAIYVTSSWMEDVNEGRWDTQKSRGSVPSKKSQDSPNTSPPTS